MQEFGEDDVEWERIDDGLLSRAVVNLKRGQASWDPASSKRVFYGPAEVTYVRYSDGSIDAHAFQRKVSGAEAGERLASTGRGRSRRPARRARRS